MLLKHQLLKRIATGEVDTVFRRWKRPTVRAGGSLRTAVGVLAIESVDTVAQSSLRLADAKRAGFASKAELVKALSTREGTIYRIRVALAGEDPRIALRKKQLTSAKDLAELQARLARFDKASKDGAWTVQYLELIAANPNVRAIELAESIGLEKKPFKLRVRKLKELGLTESLDKGYRLSPRGASFLARHSE